jgi:hypothetical protein
VNPLGVHFIPTHQGTHHYQFIRDTQPGISKLVGGSMPDVQQIVDTYAAAQGALIYLRNVARSEQHDFVWREPERAATQHVQEWHADIGERYHQARQRGLTLPPIEQIRILGLNEPVIELFARNEDMSNYSEWLAMTTARAALLDSYMATFGYEANRLGYGTGLGNISSGQPANKRPGEYATFDWFPKTRKLLESTRGKNAYTCHEYWRAETGPEGHADWHAWRFTHLDVDCDIDVLECGVDQKITSEDPHGNRGWVGHMNAAAYVDQHRRYIKRARQDSRFRCETPFTLDGDKMWESFWIDYCMAEMVALSKELQATSSTAPPVTTHLPSISTPPTPPSAAVAYVIAQAGANLRQTPDVRAGNIITAVAYGEPVMVAGYQTAGNGTRWAQVAYQGASGWTVADLLGETQPAPAPQPTPQPEPVGDTWQRSRAFIAKWEGEYQNVHNDAGNWTGCEVGKGELKGTKYGISACSYPHLDIKNLTMAQADQIYFNDYWQKSGASALPWPACLLVLDTAVLHGVGTATKWLDEVGPNPYVFAAKRLRVYPKMHNWDFWGEAWVQRVADLLEEMAK